MVGDLFEYDLRVGVTGHRDVLQSAIPAIERSVETVLETLGQNTKRKVFLSSLAEGADQIAAEVAVRLGYDLQVPLPFERHLYTAEFPKADIRRYEQLESLAARVFVAPSIEESNCNLPSRDWLYRQAGLFIANQCDVLLALWDGLPPTGALCGTADIVEYILSKRNKGLSQRQTNKRLIRILTPRAKGGQALEDAGGAEEL